MKIKIHFFLLIVLVIFISVCLGADQTTTKSDTPESKTSEHTTNETKTTPTKKESKPEPSPTPKPETKPKDDPKEDVKEKESIKEKEVTKEKEGAVLVTETSYETVDSTPTSKPGKPKSSNSNSSSNPNLPAILGGSIGGGVVVLLLIGFIVYKVRQSNRRWEDDEYLKTSSNPFKSTLEQYHSNH